MAGGDDLSLETLALGPEDAGADHLDAVRRSVLAGDAERYLSVLKQHALVPAGDAQAQAPLVYLMEWFHTWQQEYEAFVHVLEAEEEAEGEDAAAAVERDLAEMEAEAEVLMDGFGAIAAALLELLAVDSPDRVVDKHGWTLLMQAANSGLRELADVLVAAGADVNGAGHAQDGSNPLYLAVESEHTSIALALLKKGAAASATRVVKTHKPLLGADADADAEEEEEEEPDDDCALFQACRFGHLDVIEEMLAAGVDVNFAVPSSGDRALHVAVMFEMQDVAERLVACDGIQLNALNASGQTCLFGCSNLELVQMLVAKGVDPNAKDEDGETAYSMAAALGDDDVAAFLKPLTH